MRYETRSDHSMQMKEDAYDGERESGRENTDRIPIDGEGKERGEMMGMHVICIRI